MPLVAVVPLLLAVHIALAVSLLLPAVLVPFGLGRSSMRRATWRGAITGGRGTGRPAASMPGPATGTVVPGRPARGAADRREPDVVGRLLSLQARSAPIVGIGLAATGVALVVALGPELLLRPWLLAALAVYVANLVLALFVQRPGLARLIRGGASTDAAWAVRARRQRYVSYVIATLIGTIGFLMTAKPALW